MGVVNSLDDILKCLTTPGRSQHPSFTFDSRIQGVAAPTPTIGFITSLWRLNKSNGANGKYPGENANSVSGPCSKDTLGAIPLTNATEGRELRLLGWEGGSNAPGTYILYDRLAHAGPFYVNDASEKAINIAAPRNNVSGIGNEIWLEIFTTTATSSTGTCSVTYLNQNNETKTTPLLGIGQTSTNLETRILRFALADGDTGVLGIVSFRVTTALSTPAGNFAILLVTPITTAIVESQAGAFYRDFITGTPILPVIRQDACLAVALLAIQSNTLRGSITLNIGEV